MLKDLYTAALGMMPQQTRLEVISNNLANASTTGFKRDSVFERNLIDARANLYNVKGDAEQDDPPHGHYTDFKSGSMEQTDNPLDLAIAGNGFFVTQDEEGEQFLTRSGNFTISKDGYLQAKDGKFLMGQNGIINVSQEMALNSEGEANAKAVNIRINDSGELFVNDKSVANLLIANVGDLNQLEKVSNATFIDTGNADITFQTPEQTVVKQGWLESSNVDVVSEMVQMIELQRMYEAGSKVIHTSNTTLDNSIRLGRYY